MKGYGRVPPMIGLLEWPSQESQKEQFSGDGTAQPAAAEPRDKPRFSGGDEKAPDFGRGGGETEVSEDWDKRIKEMGVVYDHKKTHFWRPTPQGGVIRISVPQVESYLRNNYSHLIPLPKNYNDIDNKTEKAKVMRIGLSKLVEEIQNRYNGEYVGPLSGYGIGYTIINNIPVLINEDPVYITPKKGDYKIIEQIRDNMFYRSSGSDDWLYFDLWIRSSRAALFGGNFRPGVILVLVGVTSTCKTLVKELILTPAFGGRMADVFRFASGGSEFNDSSIRAELECIDDKRAKNKSVKDLVGGYIKERAGGSRPVLHPKGLPEFSYPTFKRLLVGCNPTPVDLAILPPIDDEAVFAKMLIFRTVRFAYPNKQYTPLPTVSDAERDELARAIREALPSTLDTLPKRLS